MLLLFAVVAAAGEAAACPGAEDVSTSATNSKQG